MDFEVLGGLDSGGVICSDNTNMQKWYGSGGFHKNQRSEDEWSKDNKLAKTNEDDFSSSKATLLFQQHLRSCTNSNPISLDTQQMLSFSSPTVSSMPYYHLASSAFARNASGCGSVSLSGGSMHGVIGGVKGPFTPSQWMELEHQALIYKYITANVPIPPYLLNPIRKALESAGFTTFAGLRPNALGWGAFHLGFSSSNDPEPGRCRRTDGKKWRCSRDAVVDQKYCERHMNRGRHRSRKPVEGQTAAATSSKLINLSSSASVTAAASSNNLGVSTHHQLNNLPQPAATNLDRSFIAKESTVVSTNVQREHNFYRETSKAEFGLVCADSLINPLNKNTALVNEGSETQHNPLRQFMDDWPKKHSTDQSDRTQLSISIGPVVASDFMSSNDKLTASPLSREHEATQMGLGIGTIIDEHSQRQGSWIPVSWESSMGGPLGEVLHSTNSSSGDCKNKSALNLMTEGWDRSPRMGSSPTGVLQKTSFGSLSNSSAGSSPRAENGKINEGSSLCNGLLGASLMNPILPAM